MRDRDHAGNRPDGTGGLFLFLPGETGPAQRLERGSDAQRPGRVPAYRRGMIAVLAGAVFAAAAFMSVAQAQQLPEPQTAGGVEYVSGGFGADMAEAFRRAQLEYPLALTFAASDEGGGARPYVADVHIVIRDQQGGVVMDVPSVGPYFLARLKPGRYAVEATYMGKAQTREVAVKEGGSAQEVMTWERP